MKPTITIISNGPGELATWVYPVVCELRERLPEVRITVALVPCPYASGNEAQTIASWGKQVRVWETDQTVQFIYSGTLSDGQRPPEKGVVLFMGGDQLFGVLMAWRLKQPVFVYTETTGRWAPFVNQFLASDQQVCLELQKKRVSPSKVKNIGNLMVDAVRPTYDPLEMRTTLGLHSDEPVISLLPGSKPFKVKYVTPLLLRIAELMWEQDTALQFVMHQSPWTPLNQIEEAISNERLARLMGGATGRLTTVNDLPTIVTSGGAQITIVAPEHHYPGMAIADLALTIPGTNTAELAIMGVPMVVLLPLNCPEEIPLDGLAGQIGNLPVIGKILKRQAVLSLAKKMGLVALPNIRTGQELTPEFKGVLDPEMIATYSMSLLANPVRLREIRLAISKAMGYPGAARKIVDLVEQALTAGPGSSAAPSEPLAPREES